MTIERRFREIIQPSVDEWIDQKINTVELERRKGLARQLAVAEDSGGSAAAAAAALAVALEAVAVAPANFDETTIKPGAEASRVATARSPDAPGTRNACAPPAASASPFISRLPSVHSHFASSRTRKVEQRDQKHSRGWAIIKKPSDSSSHLAAHHVATLPASSKVPWKTGRALP